MHGHRLLTVCAMGKRKNAEGKAGRKSCPSDHTPHRHSVISAQRPRSPATGESADEVRAEPDARRRVQRVVRRITSKPDTTTALGCNLNGCVEVHLPRCLAWHDNTLSGARWLYAVRPHALEMQLDRPLNAAQRRGLSEGTINIHLNNINKKLKVNSS